ncbi:aminoglycoside phosphotransferase (APT) family kinase protein [Mycetocola sp. CAN_C7]|uniref:aminoglycoside phosphotransferase family protein n=1 Tax=Mycetocola sp. CAN_C7 TaxID=2787724 RepID=UPI0018CBEA87
MTMHDDEIPVDAELVRTLILDQYPEAADLPIRQVRSTGTVNAVYRLGDRLAARIPRVPRWASDLERELAWLPTLGPRLPLTVPRPVFAGRPSATCPVPWAVYEWIDGTPYADEAITDETVAARELAAFILELRKFDPTGGPPAGRRPLGELDGMTREAIAASGDLIDAAAALQAWEAALTGREWTGVPVWIHTDLLRPNLIARGGHLHAVIDWGGAGIGDPAADVIAAWSVFGVSGRRAFRDHLSVDDDTWLRARGYALHQAALIIPYYRQTNPAFVASAVRTIREIDSDATS